MGRCAADASVRAWGGSVLVMEKIRRRSLPDWSMCVFDWQKTFFHAVLGGMVEKQIGWPLVLVDWGVTGVQLYMSPGTGLRWEWGFMGSQGDRKSHV